MAGSVDDYGASRQAQMIADYEAAVGLTGSGTTVEITAASVNVVFVTPVANQAAYNAASSQVSTQFASLADISSKLSVTPLSLPAVTATYTTSGSSSAAAIGGGVGGGVGGVLLLGVGYMMFMRKGKRVEA